MNRKNAFTRQVFFEPVRRVIGPLVIYSSSTQDKIRAYYQRYYRDDLGIRNAQEHVARRLNEEGPIADSIKKAFDICGVKPSAGMKVFVGGAGTGGEIIVFEKMGCDTDGIEPHPLAVEIAQEKLSAHQLSPSKIRLATLETAKVPTDFYDFVYCWTVLEHVQDVNAALQTMIRACKPGGVVYIGTPDYRFCYEGHYKLPLPMFLPKVFIKLLLLLLGRPTKFLDSLQLVTTKQVRSLLKRSGVIALQANLPYPPSLIHGKGLLARLNRFYSDKLEIQKDQYWVLRKPQ